jgi:hypothetical protein
VTITKNIVTDYGADPTGVVNIQTPLLNFNTDGQGQDANLTFPAGGTFLGDSGNFYRWIDGINTLNVTATGATLNGIPNLQTRHIQQNGIDSAFGKNARIQTASAGATSVTLTAASASAGHISRFSVGQWCLVAGWPLQSGFQTPFGFPPNWHWVDHVQITGIVGNTVSFTPALANYYSSAWPEMNRGDANETDGGGPATLVGLDLAWGGTSNFTDGTYANTNLINTNREVFQMTGGTSSNFPIYPTVNRIFRAINHTATSANVEHDKCNDLVDIQGGTYRVWHCQSSSTRLLQMSGTTVTQQLNGTVRNTTLDNCTIASCNIGPTAYGRGETFIARNTSFTSGITGGLQESGPSDNVNTDLGVANVMSKTGSVITMPMWLSDNATRTLMPDPSGRHVVFWKGQFGFMGYFKPLSVTSDTWPAADNQAPTVACSMTNGAKTLTVGTATFVSGDVGKTIYMLGFGTHNSSTNCTITNASPGVITQNNHGKSLNDPVRFTAGTGVLPAGISAGVTYYVVAANLATNTFSVSATVGGAAINTSGGSGTVKATFPSNFYTHITGYTNSTTVTLFHACANYDMTSVSRVLQFGTCNLYIQTDSTDPLPDPSTYTPVNKLFIAVPPVRYVRFESCTGNDHVVDLSQPAAWNRPLNSYTKRTYTACPTAASDGVRISEAGALAGTGSNLPMVGYIQSIKVNVTKIYTGAVGTLTAGLAQSQLFLMINGVWTAYNPRINVKVLGERVITIAGVTGTQTGDQNLSFGSVAAWIAAGFDTVLSSNITGESSSVWPSFTIEMITDQGFPLEVPTAVVPLRLRLRA